MLKTTRTVFLLLTICFGVGSALDNFLCMPFIRELKGTFHMYLTSQHRALLNDVTLPNPPKERLGG